MARQELVEKARTEYGITNADQMQDAQLEAEIAAIDAQPATDDHYVAPKKTKKETAKSSAPAPQTKAQKTRRRISLRRRK